MQSLPLGTEVDFVEGGSLLTEGTRAGGGTLAYSSWHTMHQRGETDANTCAYNDLAGISLGDNAADGGWTHPLYTLTPGVPGDSGSAFLSADGKAVGTLSTLGLAPLPASNNIGDLANELVYAQQHSGLAGLRLVEGTEPFDPVL